MPPSPALTAADDVGFCGFNVNLTGTQCMGMTSMPATTEDECAAQCCVSSACDVWQWGTGTGSDTGCWSGSASGCFTNHSNPNWVSALRTTPPGPPAPSKAPCTDSSKPCAQGYDDSSWRTVSTPHDFIVEGAPNENCDRGHGYLCFNKSWYRKTFTLDAAVEGQLVWLDFDGVYKNSDMWINGAWLGHFTSGYVSFRYYLHNATFPNSTTPVLNYGAPNTLAVLVDALSEQEGW